MALQRRIDLIHMQDRPLRQGELEFIVLDKQVMLPEGLTQEEVEKIWAEGLLINPGMADKERFFLDHIIGNTLYCSQGSYSVFYASLQNKKTTGEALTEPKPENYLKTGLSMLGVSAVCTTSNGTIILQKRSRRVTQGKGACMFPGGGLMPEDFEERSPSPFYSAKKQLMAKQGLGIEEQLLFYTGISRDTFEAENPTLFFHADLAENEQEVRKRFEAAEHRYETSSIKFIRSGAEDLLGTLRGEYYDSEGNPLGSHILGVGIGGLLLFGNSKYGHSWFMDALKEISKNRKLRLESVGIYNYP